MENLSRTLGAFRIPPACWDFHPLKTTHPFLPDSNNNNKLYYAHI